MKKTLSILMTVVVTIAAVFAMTGCSDTSQMQSSTVQSEIDRLSATVAQLTDKVNGLSSENKTLTESIKGLNVFTTDKAEYEEHETMTVYFKNHPVLKIRINFDNFDRTAFLGGEYNESYLTDHESMLQYVCFNDSRYVICC